VQVIESVGQYCAWDPLMDIQGLVAYSTLSKRTLQGCLYDPTDPIPSYRVGSRVLIRKGEFDAWLTRRRNMKADAPAQLAAADARALLAARPRKNTP
jgi:hypothetical protein